MKAVKTLQPSQRNVPEYRKGKISELPTALNKKYKHNMCNRLLDDSQTDTH